MHEEIVNQQTNNFAPNQVRAPAFTGLLQNQWLQYINKLINGTVLSIYLNGSTESNYEYPHSTGCCALTGTSALLSPSQVRYEEPYY